MNYFIFLGIIPGTKFVITFNEILFFCLLTIGLYGLFTYRRALRAKNVPMHERPVHEQLILSHPMNLDFRLRLLGR